jgi:plastocyanin
VTNSRKPTLRHPVAAAAVLSVLLTTAACGGSSAPGSTAASTTKADASVSTALLAFDPKDVRIKAGQTVTWVGGDNITHVLVEGTYEVGADGLRTKDSDDKAFSLKLTKKGQQVSHTYDKAGTFSYFCTIHKGMNGTVTVS